MNDREFEDWLAARTAELPKDIPPSRDLWPGIRARLSEGATPATAPSTSNSWSRAWPFAAGMAATALIALLIVQAPWDSSAPDNLSAGSQLEAPDRLDRGDEESSLPAETLLVEPTWISGMQQASNDLRGDYEASLDNLSPETRAVVEENLAQIHDSLAKIHAALAKDPSNAALHRLLAGTYQQELSLFSSIGALNKSEVEL